MSKKIRSLHLTKVSVHGFAALPCGKPAAFRFRSLHKFAAMPHAPGGIAASDSGERQTESQRLSAQQSGEAAKRGTDFRKIPVSNLSLGLLFRTALIVAVAALSLSCNVARSSDDKSKIHVGIVFDIGGKDDRSFNAAAWEGVKRAAKDFPIVLRNVEPGDPTSIEPAMRAFAEKHYDLIIGVGFAQAPIMERVAKDYPNLKFAIIDGVSDLPNVASLVFKEHEGSYLVGMIAAKESKTGTLGFIGGMDIPLIHKFETGYEEGARAVNPNIKVIANYVGITDAAWNNPTKGKELALAQIDKGADVIFTAAGNSGLGAFDAVEQAGKTNGRANRFVIGVDSDQNWVKPGFVLTSMVKRVDNAVYQIVQDVVEGKFKGGIHSYGLENEGVAYALDQYNKDLIAPDVLKDVDAAKQKIINGQIKVTDAMAK